jgi:hypothetical protein
MGPIWGYLPGRVSELYAGVETFIVERIVVRILLVQERRQHVGSHVPRPRDDFERLAAA